MAAKVIQIVDVQSLFGQEILNVFHFVDPSGVGDPLVLCSDYVAHVIPAIKIAQVTGLTHTALRWREVYPTAGLTATYTTGLPIAGLNGGAAADSATAWSVQFLLGATVVLQGGFTGHLKRSGCRIGGADASNMSGNSLPGSGILTAFSSWATNILNPGTDAFLLCVASYLDGARVRQPEVQSYALISSASAPSYSTQNTRKVLRGRTS